MKPGFIPHQVELLADPRSNRDQKKLIPVLKRVKTLLDLFKIRHVDRCNLPVEAIEPHQESQLFLVIGGDGTMIHYAGHLASWGLPFFGLNYGHVGFMMNRAGRGLQDTLEHLASGRFFTTGFPLLNIHGVDLEGIAREGFGLNDVYIQRMTSQSCKLKVTLWGEPLGFSPLLCDGVIVSTPLGSTAYSYNVTGSMVSINTPALTFTPIAANRTCPARNIILPLDTPFGFEILEPSKRRAQIVCDAFSLGDLVEAKVEISPREVQLAFCRSEEQRLPMRFINKMVGQP